MARRGTIESPKFEKNQSGFVRVNRKQPCRICGKPDYCTYSGDGKLIFCMRVSAGSVKAAMNGAYIHIADTPLSISGAPAVAAIQNSSSKVDTYPLTRNDI